MKIGASSMFLWDSEVDQLALKLPAIGLDTLDVWFDSPSLYLKDEEIVRTKLDIIRQAAISIVSHIASHDLNPCSYNVEVRKLTYRLAQKSILFAAAMGAEFATIHGGYNSFGKECSDYDKTLFFEYLRNLIDWNPTDVILTIENSPAEHYKLLNSPAIVLEFLEEFKELQLTFDYAHVASKILNVWKKALHQFSDRLAIVHLSNPNQEHHRLKFDKAISAFLAWLKRKAPNVILILEYEQEHLIKDPMKVLEEDARKLRRSWRGIETRESSP
ncbi:MAG: sugar phosphate isomerase/epimerase family protein [Candidatus Heimdallarchaeota archaeon]